VSRIQSLDPPDAGSARGHGVGVHSQPDRGRCGRMSSGRRSMPGLRYVVIGGEPLSPSTLLLARASAPNAIIDNVYGPTETTVWATTYRIPPDGPFPADRIVPSGLRCRPSTCG